MNVLLLDILDGKSIGSEDGKSRLGEDGKSFRFVDGKSFFLGGLRMASPWAEDGKSFGS